MSKRRIVLVLALVIGAVAAVPVVALAWGGGDRHDGGRSGAELLIGFDLRFTGPSSTAGTFVASGEVGDAGTSTVTGLTLVPFGSRDKARLSGRQEFAGENGTIVTEFDGIASDVSLPHQYGQGRLLDRLGDRRLRGRSRRWSVHDRGRCGRESVDRDRGGAGRGCGAAGARRR